MDYLDIILRGYFDINSRKYLDRYFKREFEKANKEGFEPDEFFEGCSRIINDWDKELEIKLIERQNELGLMLDRAENNEAKKELIEYCERELQTISKNNFTVHLFSYTQGKVSGSLTAGELEYIKSSLDRAYTRVAGSIKTETKTEQETPKIFEELFYNPEHAEPCLRILGELSTPVIDAMNNYIGKAKGAFPLWVKVLKNHKPKPLIKPFKDTVYKDLLNQKVKGLNLSKDASEFRKQYKRIENDKIELDIKTILSQYSQSGKLGK